MHRRSGCRRAGLNYKPEVMGDGEQIRLRVILGELANR
jgi:hypothetical protein